MKTHTQQIRNIANSQYEHCEHRSQTPVVADRAVNLWFKFYEQPFSNHEILMSFCHYFFSASNLFCLRQAGNTDQCFFGLMSARIQEAHRNSNMQTEENLYNVLE